MKLLKKSLIIILINLLYLPVFSQTKENSQVLSTQAQKGMLINASISDDGNAVVTYKMKVDKKSDEVIYEDYMFDSNLDFKGAHPTKESKKIEPNKTVKLLYASVGGTNSFNVLAMSLKLELNEWELKWDYDSQRYLRGKRLSTELVKPKNNESKYKGFASFPNDEDGSKLIIASYDVKGDDNQFMMLYVTNDLTLKEIKVPIKGNYSLVYCGQKTNKNVFTIYAPNQNMADTKKYVYTEFTNKGELVSNYEFTSPSPNMIIMDYREIDGNLYMCGGSIKDNVAYDKEFTSYAPIYNPGYTTSANYQMDKYEKKLYGAEFANFHLLKFSNSKLEFISTAPINDFKSKIVTPPSQKKVTPYKGKKLTIQNLAIAPNGDYLMTGQIQGREVKGDVLRYLYYDFICLHFDKDGALKAQYAVEKVNNDTKSEMFQSEQNFFFSKDGKTAYWEILEVKGTSGYNSFLDAYSGNKTFIANYFPRISKIDINAKTLSDFTVLGNNGEYLMYRYHSYLLDEKSNTRYYFGHDKNYEKIWVGEYLFD